LAHAAEVTMGVEKLLRGLRLATLGVNVEEF
jgi:hypothetical protein